MNINITLIGQMITFAVLIWFTMKYVWPPIISALGERQKKIADGIAAAAQGQEALTAAKGQAGEIIAEAKKQAGEIVQQANVRASKIVEDAKQTADEEGKRIIKSAQSDAEQALQQARLSLQDHIVSLAVAGAEKILERDVNDSANDELINKLLSDIEQQEHRAVG